MRCWTRLYRNGALVEENFPADQAAARLGADESSVAWLDVMSPTEPELERLTAQFGLHRVAVEAVLQQGQRAKLNRFEAHLLLAAYLIRLNAEGVMGTTEVSAFITRRVLVTVHGEGFEVEALTARWDENADLAHAGVAYLVYGLLDILVDGHFEAVQRLDTSLQEVESAVLDRPGGLNQDEIQRRTLRIRRDLVRLRQLVLPMREVVNALMRPGMHVVGAEILPYYQDVYDHVLRVIEWTDSLRDLNATMLETNLMAQDNRMNLIVKQVTSWAAVIAVPTAITGFFGQNLAFPWGHSTVEFIVSLIVTFGFAAALYVTFRHKGWL